MLLAVDIGNTDIVMGVLNGKNLVCSGRLSAHVGETEIEYSIKLKAFLEINGIKSIEGAVISSVVPALVRTFIKSVELVCGITPLTVGPGVKTGLNIKLDNPAETGADIVAGDVAVINKYKLPAIVFNLGTNRVCYRQNGRPSRRSDLLRCKNRNKLNFKRHGAAPAD